MLFVWNSLPCKDRSPNTPEISSVSSCTTDYVCAHMHAQASLFLGLLWLFVMGNVIHLGETVHKRLLVYFSWMCGDTQVWRHTHTHTHTCFCSHCSCIHFLKFTRSYMKTKVCRLYTARKFFNFWAWQRRYEDIYKHIKYVHKPYNQSFLWCISDLFQKIICPSNCDPPTAVPMKWT